MKKSPFFPKTGAAHFVQSKMVVALVGASLLVSCASPTPRSLSTLPEVEKKSISAVTKNLAEESAKLAAAQEELRKLMERKDSQDLPEPVAPKHDPLNDIVVSVKLQNATLSSILQVFSEQAKMNMLVDPEVLRIDRRASLYLNRVTARELYRHILDVFDLSGSVDGNTIKIGIFDEKFYNIDFLNSRMNLDLTAGGNVFGANSGGGGGGSGGSGGGGGGSSGGDQIRGNISLTGGSGKQVEPYDQLEANLKRMIGGEISENAQNDKENELKRNVYSLNKNSGTLFVRARPSQMKMVDKMIERYKLVMRRQVLIEAQLMDVQLNDQFQYGVDWNLLRDNVAGMVGGAPIGIGAAAAVLPNASAGLPIRTLSFPSSSLGYSEGRSTGLGYSNGSFSAALNLLRGFGNVKVLSNPSIRVRNNVPALLSVGSANRYVAKSTVTISNPGGGASTTSTDVQTDSVFSGVIIGVVPFIGEQGNVELMINPMQTEVDQSSLQLQDVGGGGRVTLPKISFKGMTTTLNIKDGDTVIIGGLIDQSSSGNDRGTPGLSDVPLFGKLFGNESTSQHTRELVIVLKVKLL
ncbi:pilus (MSHA type) biogenesis protein MshL [Undibacterium fentianense]|uniref:Pilus (MSHA type) biogenesis protein MshL n=1 Tax=Undibacterium fentianense TaxID=2828728 RepID=A0A941ID27_9BURK|nr:pilus (MSHA type) biogenesis protein MshL [Undibacterium fentianense]MBR7800854.1 pilus (MSHA type) biogenesis protein MshL [Undibacterium fentianense]